MCQRKIVENYDTEKIEAAYIAVMVSISNCGAFVSRARTKNVVVKGVATKPERKQLSMESGKTKQDNMRYYNQYE